jgi:hypothetical protein
MENRYDPVQISRLKKKGQIIGEKGEIVMQKQLDFV